MVAGRGRLERPGLGRHRALMKKNMADNPKPNLTGEPRFHMPGLSSETRMFEKHDGKWKVVYLGYVLEEKRDSQPGR